MRKRDATLPVLSNLLAAYLLGYFVFLSWLSPSWLGSSSLILVSASGKPAMASLLVRIYRPMCKVHSRMTGRMILVSPGET